MFKNPLKKEIGTIHATAVTTTNDHRTVGVVAEIVTIRGTTVGAIATTKEIVVIVTIPTTMTAVVSEINVRKHPVLDTFVNYVTKQGIGCRIVLVLCRTNQFLTTCVTCANKSGIGLKIVRHAMTLPIQIKNR